MDIENPRLWFGPEKICFMINIGVIYRGGLLLCMINSFNKFLEVVHYPHLGLMFQEPACLLSDL